MTCIHNRGYRVGSFEGYYGEIVANKDETIFTPWGRDVRLTKILRCIETQEYFVVLKFKTPEGDFRKCLLARSEIADNGIAAKLNARGASVSSKRIDVLQSYLNQQFELFSGEIAFFHRDLGWVEVDSGYAYRAHNTVGEICSTYNGIIDVQPKGNFELWHDMVVNDVLPHTGLCFVLIAALSAVTVGFLHTHVPMLNPIFSISGTSSSGKSTAGCLAASTALRPQLGMRSTTDIVGDRCYRAGGIWTWAATKNALLSRMNGNCGAVVVMDELSKTEIRDLSGVVYSISEGVDKERLSKECVLKEQPSFHTSIISIGEERLSDRCKAKQAGIPMRVFEVSGQLTESAAHANRIVTVCRENYGFAASMIAELIVRLGEEQVVDLYRKKVESFRKRLPESPFADRRSQQYGGLLLTTAVLAKKALGIDFDLKALKEFILTCEKDFFGASDASTEAYTNLLAWIGIHHQKFEENGRWSERFGKIYEGKNIPRHHQAPSNLQREIAIFPSIFQRFLNDHGYSNKAQLIKAWRKEGRIITDQNKSTYRRKIDGTAHDLIIVREFCDHDAQSDEEDVPSDTRVEVTIAQKRQFVFDQVERDFVEEKRGGYSE